MRHTADTPLPFKKILLAVGILIAAYFIYARMFSPPPGGMPGGAPPVGVAEVIEREVRQWQEFSGRIVAVDSVEIRPQVSGLIEQVHFQEGEHVEKGRLLFTLDQRPYQAALEAAQARHTLAAAEMSRARTLLAEKAIPKREYDERRNAAEVAKAELTKAQLDYYYTLIESPVAGRVGRAEITSGNLVNAGSGAPVLTTVVSDRPVYADFTMDEQSFLRYFHDARANMETLKSVPVHLGLSGEEGMPHEGHVQSFDNRLDAGSGTIRVRAVFGNEDGALLPGLFARVRLAMPGDGKTLLISDRAVGTDQNKKFVLVVGGDNTVAYREVTLGDLADGLRVVREGLKPGERIIVSGLQRAQPGMPVTPEPEAMEESSGSGVQSSEKSEGQSTP